MKVLGVTLDCKLDWKEHITLTIKISNAALFAIKMIKKYFRTPEQKILLNAHYSVLYYNLEIWLTPSLHSGPKQQILAVCSCINLNYANISFLDLHKQAKNYIPEQLALYKISLPLYKTFNNMVQGTGWHLIFRPNYLHMQTTHI
jgi:hypothetical protein